MSIEGPSDRFPLLQAVWDDLKMFDQFGIGDRDGKLEYTDLDPFSLVLKFRRFSQFWKKVSHQPHPIFALDETKAHRLREGTHHEAKELAMLWNHFTQIRMKLKEIFHEEFNPLAQNPARVVQDDIVEMLEKVFGMPPYDVMEFQEDFNGEIGGVLGDSLSTSMQFGTQSTPVTPETPPYLLPQLVLEMIGYSVKHLGILTLDRDFPTSGQKLLEPDADFTSAAFSQAANIFLGRLGGISSLDCSLEKVEGKFCDPPSDPKVYMAAIPGATLRDVLIDLERSGGWKSPAWLFLRMHSSRLLKELKGFSKKNLVAHVLQTTDRWRQEQKKEKGGFLVVALGSNDLLSYKHIVVSVAQRTAGEYEKDLEELDRQTEHLKNFGVRRLFFIPPNVADVFVEFPEGARFTDGETIPKGSKSLNHWVIATKEGDRIPRHVVLSAEEIQFLEDEYINYRDAIERVLIERSNWLVMDNRWDLPAMFKKIAEEGMQVTDVPGYGEVFYSGYEAILSPDNEHPSNFGYLVWSELIVQAVRNRNLKLQNQVEPLQYLPVEEEQEAVERSVEDVRGRVAQRVRLNPSVYRPRRLPFEEIKTLKEAFQKRAGVSDKDVVLNFLKRYWSFLSHQTLDAVLEKLGYHHDRLKESHHSKVGIIRSHLYRLAEQDFAECWAEISGLFVEWAEQTEKLFMAQVRFAQSYFSAVGARENYEPKDYQRGHRPGVMDIRKIYQEVEGNYRLKVQSLDSAFEGRFGIGATTNTAYIGGNFSYATLLAGAKLYANHIQVGRWKADTELTLKVNTVFRRPQFLQWELGGGAVFPSPPYYHYETGFRFYPWTDPAFEKEGFYLQLHANNFAHPSRMTLSSGMGLSF